MDQLNKQSHGTGSSDNGPLKVIISSKKKLFWVSIVIAFLNPVFSGLILGIAFLTEPEMKKEGKIILTISIIWGLLVAVIYRGLVGQGVIPTY